MSLAQSQFDFDAAERAKERGVTLASSGVVDVLRMARWIAVTIAQRHGDVTADDVQAALIADGYGPLGNAAGALFRGPQWEFTGQWRKSSRVSNHAHQNRVWRLK